MATILDKIVATTRADTAARQAAVPAEALREQIAESPPPRNFLAAIDDDPRVSLIAEVKKASPSKGLIRENFDPVEIARAYAESGASCISVLTDEPFFQGSLEFLRAIRQAVELPLLRKDFILESYQLLEARAAGADAVLLIAECLDDCHLRALHNETVDLGMTPLVEFYEPDNCQRVVEAGAQLIGVNNRDLRTFATDLQHTLRMRERVPADRMLVAESGIRDPEHVELLAEHGIDAMLVGESLVAQRDIRAAVRRLLGSPDCSK